MKMGSYTHYWSFNKSRKGETREDSMKYLSVIDEIRTFVIKANAAIKAEEGRSVVSGHTAHSNNAYPGIAINGAHGDMHEEFTLPDNWSQAQGRSDFCKTARKSYDPIVCGCLIILHTRLGKLAAVNSDGGYEEWEPALRLVKQHMRQGKWAIPFSVMRNDDAKAM
jgi:hypothetical protein